MIRVKLYTVSKTIKSHPYCKRFALASVNAKLGGSSLEGNWLKKCDAFSMARCMSLSGVRLKVKRTLKDMFFTKLS